MMYMATTNINLPLPDELLAQIDAARETTDTPRTAWIRRAIEQRLASGWAGHLADDTGARTTFRGQPGPNVENIRSSEQAKRGTGPRPKGGK